MNTSNAHPERQTEELPEDAVVNYLKAHPDFFERHLGILASLRLPHRTGTGAVSLVERQVSVLRQKNVQLDRKLRDLVEVARSNDHLAGRIHHLARALLEIPGISGVPVVLEERLREDFSADAAVLVLFDDHVGDDHGSFVHITERDDPALSAFRTFLTSSAPRCGRMRDAQRDFLFSDDAVQVGSAALIPLGDGCRLGFLAIGSHNSDHFNPGKSMDFLVRLGELVTSALDSAAG